MLLISISKYNHGHVCRMKGNRIMNKVFICSPYRGDVEKNVKTARLVVKHILFTVIPFEDEVGNRFFTYMDKEEYEASDDCPYGKD